MTTTPPNDPTCPKCGKPLDPDFAEQLCAACLMSGAAAVTEPSMGGDPDSKAPPDLETIQKAFSNLEILELIGHGGMGAVYKARQPHLDRLVALKVLPASLSTDPAFSKRFSREARVLAKLNHPNIVTLYDFGEAGEFFFLLMEYIDGVNLRQAMRAGGFTPEQALDVVPRICEALQFAHGEGILHRDIKPDNILLTSKGQVKIADFGIAKVVGTAEGVSDGETRTVADTGAGLTIADSTLGTPQYMAPEQLRNPHAVDHRADIYSLGVVFYEMLTGELPEGRFAPPSEKSDADRRLDAVVLRALEKEKEQRQQSAEEMQTEVETIAASEAGPGPSASTRPDSSKKVGKGFAVASLVFSCLSIPVMLAGTVFLVLLGVKFNAGVAQERIAMIDDLEAQRVALERTRASTLDALQREHGEAWIAPGSHLSLEAIDRQLEANASKLRELQSQPTRPGLDGVRVSVVGILPGSLLLLCIAPACLFAWLHLSRLRAAQSGTWFEAASFGGLTLPIVSLVVPIILFVLLFGPWRLQGTPFIIVGTFFLAFAVHQVVRRNLQRMIGRPRSGGALLLAGCGVAGLLMLALGCSSILRADPESKDSPLEEAGATSSSGTTNPSLSGDIENLAVRDGEAQSGRPELLLSWQPLGKTWSAGQEPSWEFADGKPVPKDFWEEPEEISALKRLGSRHSPLEQHGPMVLRVAAIAPEIDNLAHASAEFHSNGSPFPDTNATVSHSSSYVVFSRAMGKAVDLPDTMDLILELSSGTWQAPAYLTLRPDAYDSSPEYSSPDGQDHIVVTNVIETNEGVRLVYLLTQKSSLRQYACVAVLPDGIKIKPKSWSRTRPSRDVESRTLLFPLPLDEISHFRFQFRPIQEFVYENIELPETSNVSN